MDTLQQGNFYHIYNHGVADRNLFGEPANYEYFLHLYEKHISPAADTYAWVLMPNHFHLLVYLNHHINTFRTFLTPIRKHTIIISIPGEPFLKDLSGGKRSTTKNI